LVDFQPVFISRGFDPQDFIKRDHNLKLISNTIGGIH